MTENADDPAAVAPPRPGIVDVAFVLWMCVATLFLAGLVLDLAEVGAGDAISALVRVLVVLYLGFQLRAGRGRTLLAILTGVYVVLLLAGVEVTRPGRPTGAVLAIVVGLAVVAVVLSFLPAASAYMRASARTSD